VRSETGFAAQFDTSHHNRYLANRLGITPDGAARANRLDFWWDGQGRGSCWQSAGGLRTEPLALPACGADQLPAGAPVGRYLAEPGKLLKLYACADYSMVEQRLPAGCDWYGAAGLSRIEVQVALAEAMLLGLALLTVCARTLRRSRLAFGSLLAALAGLVLGVFGVAYEANLLAPAGLALFGLGAAGVGSVRSGRAVFGWLTVALGVLALLGAVDRGLTMIPLLPVPPSVLRMLLELIWIPWAAVVVLRRTAPVHAGGGDQ
jgi:hypothetical protein